MKAKHLVCKKGAAVRLDGFKAAKVLAIYHDDGKIYAQCRITCRKPRDYSPYPTQGNIVTVRASQAVPRDCVYISRQSMGAIKWHGFSVLPDKD